MPIPKNEFLELENRDKSLRETILDFLKKNNNKAFTAAEISSGLNVKISAVSPYLNLFEKEGEVTHKGNYWLYNLDFKEERKNKLISLFKRKGSKMDESIWDEIKDYLRKNKILSLLSEKGQKFEIIELNDLFMEIFFLDSKTKIKIEKSRFFSAYNMLKENRGEWIRIGASRVGTNPETLEGRIKAEHDGNMNGFSTAPWVAAILYKVFHNKVFDNIHFNEKKKGQALQMR